MWNCLLCFPRKMGGKEKNGFTFSSLSPWVSGSTPSPNHFPFTVFKDLNGNTQRTVTEYCAILSHRFKKEENKRKPSDKCTFTGQ